MCCDYQRRLRADCKPGIVHVQGAGSSLDRSEPEEADIRLDSTGVDLVSGGVSVDMQEGPEAVSQEPSNF